MSKTSQGQYLLRNGGTLPRSKRRFRESHDNFKLYIFMHFPWFIKVEPEFFPSFSCLFYNSTNRFYQLYQQP